MPDINMYCIEYSYVPGTAARVVYRVYVYCVVPVLYWKESPCAKRSWHDIQVLQQYVLVLLIAYPTRLLVRLSGSDTVLTYTGAALVPGMASRVDISTYVRAASPLYLTG